MWIKEYTEMKRNSIGAGYCEGGAGKGATCGAKCGECGEVQGPTVPKQGDVALGVQGDCLVTRFVSTTHTSGSGVEQHLDTSPSCGYDMVMECFTAVIFFF